MAGGSIPAQLAPIFQAAGRQFGIPAAVLAGISSVESNLFRNLGPSSTGARGGMQFEPGTARSLGVNPNDPRSAIFGAAKLLIQYGYRQNPTRAIASYNAGPGNFSAGLGYAQQVTSEARRLSSQLRGGSAGLPGMTPQAQVGTVPVTTQSFDQAGFQQALGKFIAGQAVKQSSGSANPFNATPGASKGLSSLDTSGPLFAKGLLTTSSPNPQAFVHAQTSLQRIAGGTPLAAHGVVVVAGATGKSGNIAGGFLPQGAKYVPGRKDAGRDGQTNPGGAILANGNGFVVNVLSDPNGFGPRYPVIHFTSGRYAGRTLYFGHTLATVGKGQQVRAGQVISHTGTSPVGNASVPGWLEIGFADSGSPGPMGQPAPF